MFLNLLPYGIMGFASMGSNPLTSTIINTILSMIAVSRYINTRDLLVHFFFELEEIMILLRYIQGIYQ